MSIGQPDITLTKKADYILLFTMYEDEELASVLDLTGFGSPVYRVGTVDRSVGYVEITGSLQDPVNGVISIPIVKTDFDAVPVGPLSHQLFVTDGSNNTQIARNGFIKLLAAIPTP